MLEQSVTLTDCHEVNSCEMIFDALIEVLKKELAIYQELKGFIIDEKNVLIRPSFDELNESNARKENIILKARMLEEARTNILKKIARIFELKADEIKLATVADYCAIEQRQKVEEIRQKIVLISREIRSLNERNKDFVGSTLNNVKGSLDFISSLMSQGPIYLESGKIKSFQDNGKFLRTQG